MFRKIASMALGAMILAAPVQAAKLSPEAELAKELEGRVAGEPLRCIPYHRVDSSRIIEGVGILYRDGRKLYLNRPAGADRLDDWDVLVTKVHGSQLCARDVVNLLDSSSRMPSGFVFLGDFVPYTKVKAK
jgi:hypothetical protein